MVTWAPSRTSRAAAPSPMPLPPPGDQRRQPDDSLLRPASPSHSIVSSVGGGPRRRAGPERDVLQSDRLCCLTAACYGAVPGDEERTMTSRQFNLADLFEVVVDTVPDGWHWWRGRRLTYRQTRRAGQPVCPPSREPRRRPGAHVGILARNRAEWAEAMIGCYKARTRPDQPQLPIRRIRAGLRHRQRRSRGPGVRTGPVTAGGRVDCRTGPRPRSTWWLSTTPIAGGRLPSTVCGVRGCPGLGLRPIGTSATITRRRLRALHRVAPPGCPRGSSGDRRTSSLRPWVEAAGVRHRSGRPMSSPAVSTRRTTTG